MSPTKERAFISIDEGLSENKKLNLNIAVGLLSFSTMLFHFAAVYFFTFQLGSLILVGVFLGLGNFFAFLFDVPISILQYHFKSKTLLWFGAIAQLFAMLIFGNFIFGATDFLASGAAEALEGVEILSATASFFLGDVVNLILLLLAAVFYGFSREMNDITFLSYVLNNANPSQYKTIIAQKNLAFGIGSLLGLVLSGFILSFSPKLIIIYILIIIIALAFISLKFFDVNDRIVNLADIKKYSVYFDKDGLKKAKTDAVEHFSEKKNELVQNVKSIDLKETLGNTKYIFMKPLVIKKKMIPIGELAEQTQKSFVDIKKTLLYAKASFLIVYWSFIMVLTFGFWDTFASTFLLDFLDQLKEGWSYILLGIIAIPAFVLQDPLAKVADKIGVYKLANIGLAISGLSLLFMAYFASNLSFWLVMGLAILNSVGYAICMSLSVAVFLESYNKAYATKNNLVEIDSNASAAPMKILQNLANVVGLVLGGVLLNIVGYAGFFGVFGAMIIAFLVWSIMKGKELEM